MKANSTRERAAQSGPLAPPYSTGRSLDQQAHHFVDSRLGHDFSHLPVHGNRTTGGRALPADVRAEAESRLRQSLGHVRVHDDAEAGWTALSLGARAVTFGNHIYVAPEQLSVSGPSLLMHEVAHVASQDPALGVQTEPAPRSHPAEQFARDFAAGHTAVPPRAPVGVYRDPMLRADFDRQLQQRFSVTRVFTGTFADQVNRLNYFGAGQRPGDLLQQASWTAWDPGPDSDVYDWIIAAFASLARSYGGVPPVQDLSFYEVDYHVDTSGALVPNPDVVAEYGGGHMAIYHTAVTRATSVVRPTGRSAGTTAAPRQALTAEAGVRETVVHELGHGVVETALSGATPPDPAFMTDYRREVGWTAGGTPELYDAGATAVQTALAAGTAPPAAFRITAANWNDPRWIEQPLSSYMTTHPSEDLPEALANYVNRPALLRDRSPRRFAFLDARRATLAPFLRRDFSTVNLSLTPGQMQNILAPPWTQPLPQPATPTTPSIRFREGPMLEIRF